MNQEELKQSMREVLNERNYFCEHRSNVSSAKKQIIIPNALMGVSFFVFLATWIIAVYSWLAEGTFPYELVRYASVIFGVSCCAYCGKTAYEYKADKECETESKKFP